MSTKNTAPELFDETMVNKELSQEEILLNENDILQGLIECGRAKDNADNYRKVQIKRDGAVKFEFRIRPISEDENQKCLRNAKKYAKKSYGQPKQAIETDRARYRSYLIYTATVDEDRAKTWDNRKAWDALNIITGPDMIDRVLLAGEKDRIIDLIDEISGFNDETELEEEAKN